MGCLAQVWKPVRWPRYRWRWKALWFQQERLFFRIRGRFPRPAQNSLRRSRSRTIRRP